MDYKALLGDLGQPNDLHEIKFDTLIGKSLYQFAVQITDLMKSHLIESNNSNASSDLLQSIIAVPKSINGDEYLVVINGNEYAFFVDRGVNGTRRKLGSPFNFKKESVSPAFQKSLMKWITKVGVPLNSRYSQTKGLSKSARSKKQIDEKKQMAYAMGMAIKRKGIEPTLFIQKSISEPIINEYTTALSKALGQQVLVAVSNNIKAWQ
jgi:hypothetical protein